MGKKYQLLEEFFDIGGNHEPDKAKAVEVKLHEYINNNGDDPQISDALRILQMFEVERDYNDFEKSCQVTAPVLERLVNADKWDIYDITMFSKVVGYAETYEKACALAEEALEKIEEYSSEKRYIDIKLTIHMHIMTRLLRTKYFDLENIDASEKLKNLFSKHTNAALPMCKGRKLITHKAAIMIRKGMFYRDDNLINEGFKLLVDNGEIEVYKMLQHDARQYGCYIDITISKKQFDSILGSNIRELRVARKMTTEDLAELLNVTPGSIGQLERGDRGTSGLTIRKLADIFGVSVDVLYYGTKVISLESNYQENQLQILAAYAKNLTEDEMDCLIGVAKNLLGINRRRTFGQ